MAGWTFAWQTMMQELAPQTKDGSYARPSYKFKGALGSTEFPVRHTVRCIQGFLTLWNTLIKDDANRVLLR